jgi:hypothetical protein
MINGKSPGSDGYTVDFYKFFWKDIGPFVFRSLFYGYNSGKFSEFQYQSVITCIPKEGKDRQYTVYPSDPGLFPFIINFNDSAHSLKVKFPSHRSF